MPRKKPAAAQEPEQAAAEPVTPGLQIVEMYVENIKRVRVAHIKPKGNVVVISGKNGSGKTSVLDAITWALTGTSTVPSQPIRKGERVGQVKMRVGDFVITRYFTRVDPDKSAKGRTYITSLKIEGTNREEFRQPQDLLNKLMGKISFDPLAFTRMDSEKQFETLRGLVKIDVDIDALDVEQKADYDQRRYEGNQIDRAKARLAAIPTPAADLPAQPIDLGEITKRLENAANANNVAAATRRQREDVLRQSVRHGTEARELRARADALREEAKLLDAQADQGDDRAAKLKAQGEAMAIPVYVDTAQVSRELTEATAVNAAVARAAQYRAIVAEAADAEARWTELDKRYKERAVERDEAIARAPMPIEGLSIGHGEVLYEGLPFEQASSAVQIRVSMALAMASNPKLRVLRITDGSLLDDEGMALVTEAAEKHAYQVWIERVDTTGNVGVVMVDGEASGEESVPA